MQNGRIEVICKEKCTKNTRHCFYGQKIQIASMNTLKKSWVNGGVWMRKQIQIWIEDISLFRKIGPHIYKKTVRRYINYRRNRFFKAGAQDALEAFAKACDEIGSLYWLEFGTMLGAVREKNFISHDLDIDIGMFAEDFSSKNEKIFKKYGFEKVCMYLVDEGIYGREETYRYNNVDIDIFYFYRQDDKVCCHTFAPLPGKSEIKTIQELGGLLVRELSYPYAELKKIDFLGNSYYIPSNIHEHLSASYGEKWMIKDKNYSNSEATNARIIKNKLGQKYLC